jgi:hypothetical protein
MTKQKLYSGNINWQLDVGSSTSVTQNGIHPKFYWLLEQLPLTKGDYLKFNWLHKYEEFSFNR